MDTQRRHALGRLDGLGTEALQRPVLPSGWSCLGLVHHLDLGVERFWLRAVITGDPSVIEALDDIDDAWQVAPDVPHTEVLDRYRAEVDLANAAVAATAVDTVRARGIRPVIAERGQPHGSGLGVFRWGVERAIPWPHGFRRLRVRWERRDDIHEAFLSLATCLITHRRVQRHC
ncbi:DUF664 domain-containing protein [Streptomyces sp. NPDC056910]|uniref:mycothiol transferase n=1 Tax=Streptomyces sp. NPDC056910 TaxID=3345964 RepID=UPI00369CE737